MADRSVYFHLYNKTNYNYIVSFFFFRLFGWLIFPLWSVRYVFLDIILSGYNKMLYLATKFLNDKKKDNSLIRSTLTRDFITLYFALTNTFLRFQIRRYNHIRNCSKAEFNVIEIRRYNGNRNYCYICRPWFGHWPPAVAVPLILCWCDNS